MRVRISERSGISRLVDAEAEQAVSAIVVCRNSDGCWTTLEQDNDNDDFHTGALAMKHTEWNPDTEPDIGRRKREHIEICLQEDVEGRGEGNGFDRYRFRHQGLPEIDYRKIDTSTEFLSRVLKVPLMVSSMTGERTNPDESTCGWRKSRSIEDGLWD